MHPCLNAPLSAHIQGCPPAWDPPKDTMIEEGLRPSYLELSGPGGVSRIQRTLGLTSDGPKVDKAFVLPRGEGQDVLRAIAGEKHRAQPPDALIGQDTNPSLCRPAQASSHVQLFGLG